MPKMKDVLLFIFGIDVAEKQVNNTELTAEEQYEQDYLERINNAKESMTTGKNYLIEYCEIGKTYGYLSLVMAENVKMGFDFGFTEITMKRVDAVIAISMGEAIEKSDKRPKICTGMSARVMADVNLLGSLFWIDYNQLTFPFNSNIDI